MIKLLKSPKFLLKCSAIDILSFGICRNNVFRDYYEQVVILLVGIDVDTTNFILLFGIN